MYGHYKNLSVTVEDHVATLALNRPEAMNAITHDLHKELSTIFIDLNRDEDVWVVVFEGAGDHFCAGGDLEWMKAAGAGEMPLPDAGEAKTIVFSQLDLEKPIIAAVEGACVGLGATMALMCDTVFAGENARIADPHVRVGIVAGDGGAVIWPQLIGYARAKEFLMTGDPVSGARAAEIGLVNHAVKDGEAKQAAHDFAGRLRHGAYQAIKHTKIVANIGLKQLAHQIMDASVAYELQTFRTEDHAEAIDAFLNKRKPTFTGK